MKIYDLDAEAGARGGEVEDAAAWVHAEEVV